MKKSLIASCVFALTLGLTAWLQPQPAVAADEAVKPVVVVTLSSYDELISDVGFLGKLSDNPDMAQMLVGTLQMVTQGQGLKGLDTKRSWGVVLVASPVGVMPLILLPVNDGQQLLNSVAPVIGQASDAGEGLQLIDYAGQKIYVKEQNKWLNLSLDKSLVKSPPSDPLKLLSGLDKQYDIGVSVFAQNIPQIYRDMAIDQLKSGADEGLTKEPKETDEDFAFRKSLVKAQMAQIEHLVRDTEQFTIGWVIDQPSKSLYLEFQHTAVAGTALATDMAAYAQSSSVFTGFRLPNAALWSNTSTGIAPSSVPTILSAIKGFGKMADGKIDELDRDESTKTALKEITQQVIEVIQASIATGKVDSATTVMLESKPQLLFASTVAETAKLEASLKKLAAVAAKEPKAPTVTLNADSHAGVKFHKVAVSLKDADEKVTRILGTQLDIYVGIGPKNLYVALGQDSLTTMKKILDVSGGSPRPVDPMTAVISLEAIAKFIMTSKPDDGVAPMLAAELAKTPGKDHVNIVAKPVKNGVSTRISLEEGVVRVIGQAVKLAMGGVGRQGL